MSNQTFTWNGYESELVGPLPAGATSVQLLSATGLEAPGYLVIDPDVTNPQLREWIRFNTINGDTLENLVRGLEGSIGPAGVGSDHLAGAKIRAIFTKQNLDDLFEDINQNTLDLSGPGGHIPDSGDPHSAAGYIKLTTADSRYVNVSGDTMQGVLSMAGFALTNLLAPSNPADAATKLYVDDSVFSGNHADLSNVTPSQHHARYEDSEAVDAVSVSAGFTAVTGQFDVGVVADLTTLTTFSMPTIAGKTMRLYVSGTVGDGTGTVQARFGIVGTGVANWTGAHVQSEAGFNAGASRSAEIPCDGQLITIRAETTSPSAFSGSYFGVLL